MKFMFVEEHANQQAVVVAKNEAKWTFYEYILYYIRIELQLRICKKFTRYCQIFLLSIRKCFGSSLSNLNEFALKYELSKYSVTRVCNRLSR